MPINSKSRKFLTCKLADCSLARAWLAGCGHARAWLADYGLARALLADCGLAWAVAGYGLVGLVCGESSLEGLGCHRDGRYSSLGLKS